MKAKKIIASTLMLGLITGVGVNGVFAYFSDKDTEKETVSIQTGNIDVSTYWAGEGNSVWTPTSKVTEVKPVDGGKTLSFNNVKPGDTFVRDVVVANYGSLNADMLISAVSDVDGLKVELVDVTSQTGKVAEDVNNPGRYYEHAVAPYGFIKATVKVTVPAEWTNEMANKTISKTLNDFVVGSAHQVIER